jgi:carbon-monoxide dehydrogenase iron sulfur subunit
LDLSNPIYESRNRIALDGTGHYMPLFCRHCDEPECAKSCMSGALQKDAVSGLVTYDEEKCAACFMCVMNCPYGIIKPDKVTGSKVIKCDFCEQDDANPNCVQSCPKQALQLEEV